MNESRVHLVYVTTSGQEEAKTIAQVLIEQHLVACVNIFAPMTAMYCWANELKQEEEVAFLAKTSESQVDKVIEKAMSQKTKISSFSIKKGFTDVGDMKSYEKAYKEFKKKLGKI